VSGGGNGPGLPVPIKSHRQCMRCENWIGVRFSLTRCAFCGATNFYVSLDRCPQASEAKSNKLLVLTLGLQETRRAA
jgi:hypothetical protein